MVKILLSGGIRGAEAQGARPLDLRQNSPAPGPSMCCVRPRLAGRWFPPQLSPKPPGLQKWSGLSLCPMPITKLKTKALFFAFS